jgi:DNA-binding response OmpR family regulator
MPNARIHPILLVEDEPDDASFVKRALRKSNIVNELVVCTTAREAREYIADADLYPALVIAEVYLPNGESGIDFLTWLRHQPAPVSDIPAMMFSVSGSSGHQLEEAALRSVIFLRKPATEASVAGAVQALGFVVMTTQTGGHATRVIKPK